MSRRARRLSSSGDCLLEKENEEANVTTEQPQRKRMRLSSRRSISGRRSTNFDLHLSEIYTDCIQLGTKNKINQQNAWKAKLVDVMDKILLNDIREKQKTKSSQTQTSVCNFQVASNTLDTSVKIYSYRVDSVHNDTYRVLSGLNRSTKQTKDAEDETQNQGGNESGIERTKKRKNVSLSHTLDSLSNLNAKRLDMEFSVDPLFHKTAAAFDEGGARGLLLSQLGVSIGCNVVFDSTEYHPEQIVQSGENYDSSDLLGFVDSNWSESLLCPFFEDFSFVPPDEALASQELPDLDETCDDDQESFDDYSASFEILSQRDDFMASQESDEASPASFFPSSAESVASQDAQHLSPDALASQISEMTIEQPCSYPEYDDDNESMGFVPCDSQNDPEEDAISRMLEGPSTVPSIDFIKNLASDSTEYNYFNNSLMSNWAGPEHWKFKQTKNIPLKNNEDVGSESKEKTKKRRTKKDFFLDFFAEDDTDYDPLFAPAKRGGTISKEGLLNSNKPTTLPFVDVHFDIKRFTQLFCKPGKIISFQLEAGSDYAENIRDMQAPLEFENEAPMCADSYDDPDDGGVGGWPDTSQDSFTFGSQFSSQLSDGLVDEPEKVRNIKISYARRAKRVDIEKLKNSIWTELCTTENPDASQERVITENVNEKTFSEVLTSLPKSVPASQMADLSVPLCFICLLDLANKKGLQIDQLNNDLAIKKYEK